MTKAKHTPAPWEYRDLGQKDGAWQVRANARRGGTDMVEVCTVYHWNAEANARLIAASPELLDALRDMVSDRECLSQATIDFAKQAIAKATGEAV